ncbi:MAG TPA: hypothetical protein VGQ00_00770 [Candidatus Norongarragalinales archaeon]|jgi:plastocyanin|nr:hypothetical protein [Candidatus Norongarragalinales archaeon]
MKNLISAIVILAALVLAGCSQPTTTPAPIASQQATLHVKGVEAIVTQAGFIPDVLTISENTSVVWRNTGQTEETLYAPGMFEVRVTPGLSTEYRFTQTGTYHVSSRNSSINQTIIVVAK